MFMTPKTKTNIESEVPEQAELSTVTPDSGERPPRSAFRLPRLQKGKIAPAFWTVASILSLTVNLILIIVLIILGLNILTIKNLVTEDVLGGLHNNFVKMDEASIITTIRVQDTIQVVDTIQVQDTMPVVFDLPLKQDTQVTLTEPTYIGRGTILFNGIWVPLDIILPQGTTLDINLDMVVPVNQVIPVNLTVPVVLNVPVDLTVPVNIPLAQTELHEPFVGLQEVVSPYYVVLSDLPSAKSDVAFCNSWLGFFCNILK